MWLEPRRNSPGSHFCKRNRCKRIEISGNSRAYGFVGVYYLLRLRKKNTPGMVSLPKCLHGYLKCWISLRVNITAKIMYFIIKRSGKDEKSVAWSFFSFSSCFIDLIPNFVSNIGFRISRWRETELKGNPVQIRNYPRSCKFYPPIVWGSVVTFLATGYCENREGATTETSQKTCRYCLYHSWLSGERR